MKLNGKRYTARAAYVALDTRGDAQDAHGHRIWSTRMPNKVKIFSWLYYKDRLSTRANLFAKHILADEECVRCSRSVEDRHHVFFTCPVSAEVWGMLHLVDVASLPDAETWEFTPPAGLYIKLWPSFYRPFSGGSGMQETMQSLGMKILLVDLLSPKFVMIL